jgi:cytochrome c oxidase subunit 3
MSDAAIDAPKAHDGHDEHHDEFLGHHFKDHGHQFNTGKMGIWLFLGQELLFFGGLFCAYAIYRGMHPEIFIEGHHFLDKTMGAINTVVLLFSSLTAAWSVRCAQLNNKKGLIINILITIACACIFLVIKYFEYSHKFHDGLLWGSQFAPSAEAMDHALGGAEADRRLHIFFSIYFVMTGLHGIHVIGGIVAYLWLLKRAVAGQFSSKYFGPVDFVALYWHLVDLIWIFLFPLLYLIH